MMVLPVQMSLCVLDGDSMVSHELVCCMIAIGSEVEVLLGSCDTVVASWLVGAESWHRCASVLQVRRWC